jgi:hypothetical protein
MAESDPIAPPHRWCPPTRDAQASLRAKDLESRRAVCLCDNR